MAAVSALRAFVVHVSRAKSAKRLHSMYRGMWTRLQFLEGYERQDPRQQLLNPVWHTTQATAEIDMRSRSVCCFTLRCLSNAENADTLWGFIGRYRPGVTTKTHPRLNGLSNSHSLFATSCCRKRNFREPTDAERGLDRFTRRTLAKFQPDAVPGIRWSL